MSEVIIYGIKNCDTMKKAFSWLDENGVDYTFSDYKKNGVDGDVLKIALSQHGWARILNRRGTTWRKLPDDVKISMNDEEAQSVAVENPSIIKRPLVMKDGVVYLGFDVETFGKVFAVC